MHDQLTTGCLTLNSDYSVQINVPGSKPPVQPALKQQHHMYRQIFVLVMPQCKECGADQAAVDWAAFEGMLESSCLGFTACTDRRAGRRPNDSNATDQATPFGEVVRDGLQAADVVINGRAASGRALPPHHTHPCQPQTGLAHLHLNPPATRYNMSVQCCNMPA